MKLSNTSYGILTGSIEDQAIAIDKTADRHLHNVEEGAKDGSTETVLGMLTELESSIRVLKRRLIDTLPAETQSKYYPV